RQLHPLPTRPSSDLFDWHEGDFAKSGIMDPSSVDEELLREAALGCPTGAIGVEEIEELLPWQLRGKEAPRRVEKTFMFTDIEGRSEEHTSELQSRSD